MRDFAVRASRIAVALTLIAAAVGASSCTTKEVIPPTPTKKLSIKTETGASYTAGATVGYDTKKTSIAIVAGSAWSLTADADWITPSLTSGTPSSSSVTIEFTLDPNRTDNVRKGTVTIKSADETDPYKFTITQNAEYVLTGINKWIYDEMCENYYWNTVVQATEPPSNSLDYNLFLKELIASMWGERVQDTSNGENPPTIDGHWNEGGTARTEIYSYIEKVSGGTRAGEAAEQTFGLGIIPAKLGVGDPVKDSKGEIVMDADGYPLYAQYRFAFLVSWVREGGPAAALGIKRGTWIVRSDGADFTDYSFSKLYYSIVTGTGSSLDISTSEGTVDDIRNPGAAHDGTRYTLNSEELPLQPILTTKSLTSEGGKKVAYLAYNGFEIDVDMEPYNGDKDRFMTEMRAAFKDFKAAGATEMVLDLRYNPGGYIMACQVLTSLISGADTGDVFAKMKRNPSTTGIKNPEVWNFTSEGTNALKLKKLYVLASGNTASASEMVINSLRGIGVEVVIIGEKTNGKNVGMDFFEKTDASGTYHMWPITFKVLNALDFCDYAGGFAPDRELYELAGVTNREPLYDLGDPRETLLKEAFAHIDTGAFTKSTRAAASGSALTAKAMPAIPSPRGGAKIIPDRNR